MNHLVLLLDVDIYTIHFSYTPSFFSVRYTTCAGTITGEAVVAEENRDKATCIVVSVQHVS